MCLQFPCAHYYFLSYQEDKSICSPQHAALRRMKNTAKPDSSFLPSTTQCIHGRGDKNIFSIASFHPRRRCEPGEAKTRQGIRCRKYWDCDLHAFLHIPRARTGMNLMLAPSPPCPKSNPGRQRSNRIIVMVRQGSALAFRPLAAFKTLERLAAVVLLAAAARAIGHQSEDSPSVIEVVQGEQAVTRSYRITMRREERSPAMLGTYRTRLFQTNCFS